MDQIDIGIRFGLDQSTFPFLDQSDIVFFFWTSGSCLLNLTLYSLSSPVARSSKNEKIEI